MENLKEPAISIIIPVYNVERYLPLCLESVVQQSFDDFEVIVVDDGSIDKSGAIADDFAQKDGRFRVIHKSKSKLAQARNTGLEIAQGQYVAFVDSDDWIHPKMLECLMSTLVKTGSDIAMTDFIKTDDSDYVLPEHEELPSPYVFDGYSAVKSLIENVKPSYSVVWNKLYDRRIIGETRFLDMISEDTLFNMELYSKADIVSHLPVPLVCYRQREDSITNSADEAYYVDKVASVFHGYKKIFRYKSPQLEALFLWRWFKYALNRMNLARGTKHEQYARQIVSTIMTEYWPDAERLLPWHKRILLKLMWKNQHFNRFVLAMRRLLKSLK